MLLLLFHLLLLFFTTVYSTNYTAWYQKCGHLVLCQNLPPTVGFPFWGGLNNWRPKECGYPDMHIQCPNGINATITMNGMLFEVLTVVSPTKNMIISREDYANGSCLKTFRNTTLDFRRFTYSPDTLNVTVLYGCSPPKNRVFGKFKCTISGVNQSLGYYNTGVADPSIFGCRFGVTVPIQDFLEPQLAAYGLSQVFRKGFEVNYTLNGEDDAICNQCEGEISKGRCGYDHKMNRTICVCEYGTEARMCRGNSTTLALPPQMSKTNSGKKNFKTILIIGLSTVLE